MHSVSRPQPSRAVEKLPLISLEIVALIPAAVSRFQIGVESAHPLVERRQPIASADHPLRRKLGIPAIELLRRGGAHNASHRRKRHQRRGRNRRRQFQSECIRHGAHLLVPHLVGASHHPSGGERRMPKAPWKHEPVSRQPAASGGSRNLTLEFRLPPPGKNRYFPVTAASVAPLQNSWSMKKANALIAPATTRSEALDRIKTAMVEKKLTQAELADAVRLP